VTYIFVMFDGF